MVSVVKLHLFFLLLAMRESNSALAVRKAKNNLFNKTPSNGNKALREDRHYPLVSDHLQAEDD